MRIEDKLDKNTIDKLNKIRFSKKKSKRSRIKKHEKFSDKELENLMGVNRPTYKRCNGAFKQK